MKKVSIAITALLLISSSGAEAATSVAMKVSGKTFDAQGVEGFALSKGYAVTLKNLQNNTLDVVITALDSSGKSVWSKVIDSGSDEIATAIDSDLQGNIWVAGNCATIPAVESKTPLVGVENPDSVTVDNPTTLRPDMSSLTLWKISPLGELLLTLKTDLGAVPLVGAIDSDSLGASVIGNVSGKSFLISSDVSGKFSKVIYVGGEKTSLNDLKRLKSGSINLFGSSAETLFGKKPAGKRDGVLITISQSGKISQLVRSSAIKASRDWQSATETIATTGMVKVSTSTETAITQFTSAFKPTWTLRLAGAGASRVTFGNKLTYLAFTSTSKISGVTGWKPTTPGLVVLAFDSKGAIKSAYNFPGLTTPISLSYSLERGVTGLALSAKNTVSIFQLN